MHKTNLLKQGNMLKKTDFAERCHGAFVNNTHILYI